MAVLKREVEFIMNTLSRVTEKLTEYLSYLGMIGVLAMMLHIGADIIGRTVFEVSVPATLEMVTRYYMLMLVLLPLPWVEQKRFMIMVEAFSGVRSEERRVGKECRSGWSRDH